MAGTRITQLHPKALPGRRYGSFVGKPAGATHPVGRITQLVPHALPGQRYGDFSGRAPAPPVVITGAFLPIFRPRRGR